MPDIDKVIKGLDSCEKIGRLGMNCEEVACPYYEDNSRLMCWIDVLHDAIELLKEQEAIKPIAQEDDTFECNCGTIVGWDELDASGIVPARFNYCPFCGKPIDWKGMCE